MCLVNNVCVFAAIFLLYPQENDGLFYTKWNQYKMADGKIVLQILSLRSQPSEGSAAHRMNVRIKVNNVRSRF